jgi:ATP-dependent helicase HrpA
LVYPGFLAATPWDKLAHLSRYLKAKQLRMDKYAANPSRDGQRGAEIAQLYKQWEAKLAEAEALEGASQGLKDFRWLIEELRVSLFAQELKTPFPVSLKRLQKAWGEIEENRR